MTVDATCDIAIVGGGFSGLMTAANIVHGNPKMPRIAWIDEGGRFARGTAYSTAEAAHLLNVPAEKMGAWADDIDHFYSWLKIRHPGYGAADFVPRMIYGEYLDGIRAETAAGSALQQLTVGAIGATPDGEDIILRLADHTTVRTRALVIATGNPPCRDPGWPRNDRYIPDFWHWRLAGNRVPGIDPDTTIVILGAGLTTADAILSLRRDGFGGAIIAVSTHGWMPRVHATGSEQDFEGLIKNLHQAPQTRAYLCHLRDALKTAPDDWRMAIDALRPQTVALWQALDEREKSRFLRHLLSLWNVHRHRMAPQIEARLAADKKLTVVAGRITGAMPDGVVTIQPRGGGRPQTVAATKIINCTGPSYRGLIAGNPLLADLHRQGLVRSGPLGLGIATPETSGLYAIGTPLIGERLETTAVPDLRDQAADVAAKILAYLAA